MCSVNYKNSWSSFIIWKTAWVSRRVCSCQHKSAHICVMLHTNVNVCTTHTWSWNLVIFNIILGTMGWYSMHCNPLQGNYRVELLHREIPVVITGHEFTEYNFLLFWLHFFPYFINIEIVALVPVMCTGNCQFILQGLKGCSNTL